MRLKRDEEDCPRASTSELRRLRVTGLDLLEIFLKIYLEG